MEKLKVGDFVTNSWKYTNLNGLLSEPTMVTRVAPGPDYAGGQMIFCIANGVEQGFYRNAVNKVGDPTVQKNAKERPLKRFWDWYTDLGDMGLGCLIRIGVTAIILLAVFVTILSLIIKKH